MASGMTMEDTKPLTEHQWQAEKEGERREEKHAGGTD
jgi:hypothetical protein